MSRYVAIAVCALCDTSAEISSTQMHGFRIVQLPDGTLWRGVISDRVRHVAICASCSRRYSSPESIARRRDQLDAIEAEEGRGR